MKTLLFVDDEPRILQGMQRQFHGMRHEWQMNFMESGRKALEFMAVTPVDVVVTDMMMPGMDGSQLLAEVRERFPNTVRLVLSGQSDLESVMKLVGPAHQYLSKPCDMDELRTAISRSFAISDLLLNEQLKRLTTRLSSLPSLPTLYLQLTEELRQENPSVEQISEIISRDVGMTSKIMQLVNSAFFGLPQTKANIKDAVNYLGMTTIRDLVLSLQVFGQFDQATIKEFSIEALSQHCCLTASLARKIASAEHCDANFGEQCFLAGLLHDVGQLILASSLPQQYALVIENARQKCLSIWETEQAEYGATHTEVGGYLLSLWGLPAPVVEAVLFHHRPGDCAQNGFSPAIAVHAANVFAHDLAVSHADWPGNQVDIAVTQQGLLHIAKLIEAKQRMVTGAAKMSVESGSFLFAVGLAHGTVHVKYQFPHWLAFPQPVNPFARQLRQHFQVARLGRYLGLEPSHLAGRSGRVFRGPPADHMPHRGINREPFGIIGVFVACQPAEDGLPHQRYHRVLRVLTRPPITQ